MTLASWALDEVLEPIIANRTHSDRDQPFVMISSPRPWRPLSQSSSGGGGFSACGEINFIWAHEFAVDRAHIFEAKAARPPDARRPPPEKSTAPPPLED